MPLDKFLALVAALTGTLGSVYVLRSSLAMSPGLTADLATPRWGFSTVIIDSLSDQRADSIVGASAFGVGFGIGSAAGALLASVLLVLLVPTNEYRARLWFLLATTGPDFSLEAVLWGAFWLGGTLALLAVHRLGLRSVLGAGLAAAVYVAALKAGAWKWLPEFTSFGLRLAITVFTTAVAVWLVLRAGRVRGPAPEEGGA